jgi:hypothetical protein
MMMTHRIMLKTHPLLDDSRSLRPFDLILRRLANDERPEGRHADAPSGTRGTRAKANRVRVRSASFLFALTRSCGRSRSSSSERAYLLQRRSRKE